jgi:hypothetical protein
MASVPQPHQLNFIEGPKAKKVDKPARYVEVNGSHTTKDLVIT